MEPNMIERTPTAEERKSLEIDSTRLQGEAVPPRASQEAPKGLMPPETRGATERYKVLIVDDEKAVLEVVNEMLEQAGYETVAVSSPVEALKKAKRQKFDAVILDVYMPEMSGMLFHAKLRVVDSELAGRTVFMSGYVSRDELRQYLSATPTFLEKPFKSQQLSEMVSRVLPSEPRR